MKDRLDVKNYLDSWIKSHPAYSKGRIIQQISGGVSVNQVKDKMSLPGLLAIGDAARLIDPITGGGIANGMISGKFAAQVSKKAIDENNFSEEMMKNYDLMVKDKFERKHLRNWFAKPGLLKKFFGSLPLAKMPGGNKLDDSQLDQADEKLRLYRIILDSMTYNELENPDVLNAKRIKRIAAGSGQGEKNVRQLLKEYNAMKKNRNFKKMLKSQLKGGNFSLDDLESKI